MAFETLLVLLSPNSTDSLVLNDCDVRGYYTVWIGPSARPQISASTTLNSGPSMISISNNTDRSVSGQNRLKEEVACEFSVLKDDFQDISYIGLFQKATCNAGV